MQNNAKIQQKFSPENIQAFVYFAVMETSSFVKTIKSFQWWVAV